MILPVFPLKYKLIVNFNEFRTWVIVGFGNSMVSNVCSLNFQTTVLLLMTVKLQISLSLNSSYKCLFNMYFT